MKRTDLIALAERLAHAAEYVRSASPTLSEPEAKWLADQDAAVSLMRQIAQAQPVAWADCQGEPSKHRVYDYTHPLYTLPLED